MLFGDQVRRDCRTVAATPPSASLRTTSLVTPSGRRIWEAQATGRKRSLGRQVGRKQWPVGLKTLQIYVIMNISETSAMFFVIVGLYF